ncbi:cupin domain-containing protein [Rhodococcus sp. IEGM 1409]|uniref:cupin domain-containing protein n=1 Tax=Rhodococcus sp. IEGM 1409 TaxID=3047082 RepID=UPI0024B69F9A|nr:cupin domain-containing protein [Rhodococcus sp. IEGM 1409]MDI9902525.1 cupin domain-containing protein [Rhodococcus sp. IEGM 1409]
MNAAEPTISLDDDRVRVTSWRFPATGSATGSHRHEYDYVVVPITGGRFVVADADGSTREMTQTPGQPYQGTAGTDHDVTNASDSETVFVEIELKPR